MKYPAGIMRNVGHDINGLGFFPGANGTFDNSTIISNKPIMILGQDQDNEKGFAKSCKVGNESYSPTWTNLRALLEKAHINEAECFFTNCIMGIRLKTTKNTGKSPAHGYPDFLKECLVILEEQIRIQKPKLIISLGRIPAKLLSVISKDLLLKFIAIDEFKEIDQWDFAVNRGIEFDNIPAFKTNMVVLYHPSFRALNIIKRQRIAHSSGIDPEVEMLREILKN